MTTEQQPVAEDAWSNHACLGYVILGAKDAGFSEEEVRELVRSVYNQFDFVAIGEAVHLYYNSDY